MWTRLGALCPPWLVAKQTLASSSRRQQASGRKTALDRLPAGPAAGCPERHCGPRSRPRRRPARVNPPSPRVDRAAQRAEGQAVNATHRPSNHGHAALRPARIPIPPPAVAATPRATEPVAVVGSAKRQPSSCPVLHRGWIDADRIYRARQRPATTESALPGRRICGDRNRALIRRRPAGSRRRLRNRNPPA
jgi:hypothetical protein